MKKNIKILASIKTDAMEGWVWICPTLISENGFYKIENLDTNKKVFCYLRIVDENFVSQYNSSQRTFKLNKEDNSVVINEFYRKKLGIAKANMDYNLEITEAGWYSKYLSFEFSHPNPYVRQSSRLTLISFFIGIIALGLTIWTIIKD